MPKIITLRSPYRLSLPSPTSEYEGDCHSSPATPSPPSRRIHPRGLVLNAPSKGPSCAAVKREDSSAEPSSLLNMQKGKTSDGVGKHLAAHAKQESDRAPGFAPRVNLEHGLLSGSRAAAADLKARVAATQRRLRRAHLEIEELKDRVRVLQLSEKRLKVQVDQHKERAKDSKVEAEETLTELLRAEERLDSMEESATKLRRDFNRFRGWWLTENRCLKVALDAIPKRKWDAGFESIKESSYSRYMTYCGSGSN